MLPAPLWLALVRAMLVVDDGTRITPLSLHGEGKEEAASPQKGSQPRLAALGSPFQRKGLAWTTPFFQRKGENAASQTSHEEGLRYENAVFPILSFRAKARNLFRLRSGKGCEDSSEREAPCFQRIGRTVFHAGSITKENGNGKRKRSLGCARDDETRERLFPFLFNLLRKPTPASLRSAAPSKGRGSRGHSLLPMEGGAPKGRRLDGEAVFP